MYKSCLTSLRTGCARGTQGVFNPPLLCTSFNHSLQPQTPTCSMESVMPSGRAHDPLFQQISVPSESVKFEFRPNPLRNPQRSQAHPGPCCSPQPPPPKSQFQAPPSSHHPVRPAHSITAPAPRPHHVHHPLSPPFPPRPAWHPCPT